MQDEHVIASVDGQADRRAEDPVIRQRSRPERVDLEHGRTVAGSRLRASGGAEECRAMIREGHEHQRRESSHEETE
jgi:hypothetical protein